MTSIVMKSSSVLMTAHICVFPYILDPLTLQSAPTRSADDTIAQAVHTALSRHVREDVEHRRQLCIQHNCARQAHKEGADPLIVL